MEKITSLKDHFNKMSKDLLLLIAKMYGVKITKTLKKQEIVDCLYSSVIANIPDYLKKFSPHEIYLIREILDTNPLLFYEDDFPKYELPILVLGLVQMCGDASDDEDDVASYYIPDDVREVMSECIDDVLDNDFMYEYHEFHKYVFGMLNLYGIVPFDMLLDKISEFPFSSVDLVEDMIMMVKDSYMLQTTYVELDKGDGEAFVSPFVDDYKSLWKEIKKCKVDYRDFNHVEFTSAGDFPFPMILNDYFEEIEEYLERYEKAGSFTPAMIDEIFYDIWIISQYDESPASVMSCVMEIIPEEHKDYAYDMFNYITKAMNVTPRWCFKGNTPEYMHKLGCNSSNRMSNKPSFYNGFIDSTYVRTEKKVGRNDSCPCGSGKKYKNCCGREN